MRSFGFAWSGLRHFAATEHNGWIHSVATAGVVVTGLLVGLDLDEWRWISIAIAIVWIAEAFNTAIERLADAVTIEADDNVRWAKDVAAGGVLIAALTAALIGLSVFGPRLHDLLS